MNKFKNLTIILIVLLIVSCGARVKINSIDEPFLAFEEKDRKEGVELAVLKVTPKYKVKVNGFIWNGSGKTVTFPSDTLFVWVESVNGKRVRGNKYIHLLPGREYNVTVVLSTMGNRCLSNDEYEEVGEDLRGGKRWKLRNIGRQVDALHRVSLNVKLNGGRSYTLVPSFDCEKWDVKIDEM